MEAEKRLENAKPSNFISHDKVLEELGINEPDLSNIDVEIE